jgi:hypothetical protein
MTRVLMVPHGGSRNDTVCTVEIKIKSEQLSLFDGNPVVQTRPTETLDHLEGRFPSQSEHPCVPL